MVYIIQMLYVKMIIFFDYSKLLERADMSQHFCYNLHQCINLTIVE